MSACRHSDLRFDFQVVLKNVRRDPSLAAQITSSILSNFDKMKQVRYHYREIKKEKETMSGTIFDLIDKRVVLFDGGMGTELIKHGFSQGECPEKWNVEHPDIVARIHADYFAAGSDAVLTNSFGGSRIKLSAFGLEDRCFELNKEAASIAVRVRPRGGFIGGSMGPTGKFLQPMGPLTEDEVEEAYAVQAKGLDEGGVDFLIIETQYDIQEALCALRAARRASRKPVFVTMTFNRTAKGYFTVMGNGVADFCDRMEQQEVQAVGANCTLDSSEIVPLVSEICNRVHVPVIVQANAGQPSLDDQGRVSYGQSVEEYVRHVGDMIRSGARIIGGCCGTDASYIAAMAEIVKKASIKEF